MTEKNTNLNEEDLEIDFLLRSDDNDKNDIANCNDESESEQQAEELELTKQSSEIVSQESNINDTIEENSLSEDSEIGNKSISQLIEELEDIDKIDLDMFANLSDRLEIDQQINDLGTDVTDNSECPSESDANEDQDSNVSENDKNESAFDIIEKKAIQKQPFVLSVIEWLELFVCSLVAVMIVMCFFVRHSPVIGSSMEPTLKEGDILLISEFMYEPKVGDIVIIQAPYNPKEPLVKRIIAMGGQKIEINFVTWEIKVDGELIEEPYISYSERDLYGLSMRSNDLPVDENGCWSATVPSGCVFVLGDNRTISKDSRSKDVGFVDVNYIIGHVKIRIFPFDKIGTLWIDHKEYC